MIPMGHVSLADMAISSQRTFCGFAPTRILTVSSSSDFGGSSVNRRSSRSNVANTDLTTFSPNYRPPEFDMSGGRISRSFDIWSLGCFYLEMATWILAGFEGIQQFELARLSQSGKSGMVSIGTFFDISSKPDDGDFFSVKASVVEESPTSVARQLDHVRRNADFIFQWVSKLHRHDRCDGYMHNFLLLIERKMLLVEGLVDGSAEDEMQRRITSTKLVEELKRIHHHAKEFQDYVLTPIPPLTEFLAEREPTAVRVAMDDQAPIRVFQSLQRVGGMRNTKSVRHKEQRQASNLSRAIQKTSETTGSTEGNREPDNSSGYRPLNLPVMQTVKEIIQTNVASVEGICRAEFTIVWELQQCVRDELEGPDLGPVLTISGSPSYCWAVSCIDYVEETWRALDRLFLEKIQQSVGGSGSVSSKTPLEKLDQVPIMDFEFCSLDEESGGVSTMAFQSTPSELMALAQFLSWIAATFRWRAFPYRHIPTCSVFRSPSAPYLSWPKSSTMLAWRMTRGRALVCTLMECFGSSIQRHMTRTEM